MSTHDRLHHQEWNQGRDTPNFIPGSSLTEGLPSDLGTEGSITGRIGQGTGAPELHVNL